jgi:glucan phosphorylase
MRSGWVFGRFASAAICSCCWDTNVDGNSDEDKALTSRLYGGDRRTRILQELILGVGGIRALRELGVIPGIIHLNEGHSAFAILEVARTGQETSEYIQRAKLDPNALTIGIARWFAVYKRMDLLFHDPTRLDRLVNNPQRKVQFIFAGKAHPQDERGKYLLQTVFRFTRDPRLVGKVVFIENYDINVARHLVQGVDAWLHTPRRPWEASGTSGQKVAANGGLNIFTLDGWWAQAYDGDNGFAIGRGGEHSNLDYRDQVDIQALYSVLENEVVPLFCNRDADGIPRGWIARQKHALRTLPWRFSARRMVVDYTLGCYLPAAGGLTSSLRVYVRLLSDVLGQDRAGRPA